MSYSRINAPPEPDPLFRQHSPYEGVPAAQPSETTCLAAAFETAARSVGAVAQFAPVDLVSLARSLVGPDGWNGNQLSAAVRKNVPHVHVEAAHGPNITPDGAVAFVLLIPGVKIGHAVALVREHAPALWDPWPPGQGRVRELEQDEYVRWRSRGFPALAVTLR